MQPEWAASRGTGCTEREAWRKLGGSRSEGRWGQSPKQPRRFSGATNEGTLAATGRRGGVRAGLGVSRRRVLRAEQVCNAA